MNLPPYAQMLGLVEEPGDVAPTYLMAFDDKLTGRPEFLHGGAIAGLLEMAAFGALRQALGREGRGGIKPVNVTVDYMRGGKDNPTRARGHVTRLGKRVAIVEATAWQDAPDKPIASARLHFLIGR